MAREDSMHAAEGAIHQMVKLWPALEYIDTPSGALGAAVYKALDAFIPFIVKAPPDDKTRGNGWLGSGRRWLPLQRCLFDSHCSVICARIIHRSVVMVCP